MHYIILILLILLCGCHTDDLKSSVIELEEPKLTLKIDSLFIKEKSFQSINPMDSMYFTYWNKPPSVELFHKHGSLIISGKKTETETISVRYKNQTKSISIFLQPVPAVYTNTYIRNNTGKVNIGTPEVYELAHIVLALHDTLVRKTFRMNLKSDYFSDVYQWFSPYKQHPVFSSLSNVDFYSFIENAPAYQFKENRIVPDRIYTGFRAKNRFKTLIPLLEDFAEKSRFRAFYKSKHDYYHHLAEQFSQMVNPKNIWIWLEHHFPQRYQSHRVFFSTLGRGSHSARNIRQNQFSESVMFVSSPDNYSDNDKLIASAKLTRSFFTEIDHTYVNPTSDMFINEINQSLSNLNIWYSKKGYALPYLTFNEYITWALFTAYAWENYPEKTYLYIKNYIEQFMENKRGFIRFSEFNQFFIQLYKQEKHDHTLPEMYPKILQWFKESA